MQAVLFAGPGRLGVVVLDLVVGGRTAVARGGVVVAELLDPAEAHWLQAQARNVRQGFMDPKQEAAFEEFLARQPSLDER